MTGRVPYPASTSLLKILAHREQPLPSIRDARPDVPPELAGVLARMFAKRPEDRWQSARDLLRELQRLKEGPHPEVVAPVRGRTR